MSRRHDENEDKCPDYLEDVVFNAEESRVDTNLVEVSEKTGAFHDESCRRSLNNAVRIQMWSHYGLPKNAATKTPQLETYMRTDIHAILPGTPYLYPRM